MRDTWAPALQKHKTPPADVFARAGFCAAVVSNDYSAARNAVMDELFARGLLQSGGGFRNNTGGPVADKQAFQRGFRFALAIENSADPGYCTEKIVDAWAAGAVPVYGGDPLVKQEFNPAAFVCADDYESPAALADALSNCPKTGTLFVPCARRRSCCRTAARLPIRPMRRRGISWAASWRAGRTCAATAAAGAASMKTTSNTTTPWPKTPPPQTAVAENLEDLELRVQS